VREILIEDICVEDRESDGYMYRGESEREREREREGEMYRGYV